MVLFNGGWGGGGGVLFVRIATQFLEWNMDGWLWRFGFNFGGHKFKRF